MISRRNRKKDLTASTIIDAAMALFDAQGFDTVTMEGIAAHADVAKATLYRYFPTKEAVIAGYFRRLSRDRQPQVEHLIATVPDTRQRLLALYTGVGVWFAGHQHYLRPYLTHRLSGTPEQVMAEDQRSGFHRHVAQVLETGQRQGDLRSDMAADYLLTALEGMFLAQVMAWLHQNDDLSARITAMIALFMDGAKSP